MTYLPVSTVRIIDMKLNVYLAINVFVCSGILVEDARRMDPEL